ncbi:hypothetical protein [Stieleria marina]|uniref:hypothetical protein n=1 Tax=Stieleria marina TaxID=1930275 RepID=UPI003AF38704
MVIDDNPAIHRDFRKILVADDRQLKLDNVAAAFFGDSHDQRIRLDVDLQCASQGKEGRDMVCNALANGQPL